MNFNACLRAILLSIFTLMMTGQGIASVSESPYPFTTASDATRFHELIKEIRCVVCQNQSIADSNAPLANDLRKKVYLMVTEKKSNQDIKDYLVKRYGEFILLEPRFNKLTFILWLFPFLGFIFVIVILFLFNARQKKLSV